MVRIDQSAQDMFEDVRTSLRNFRVLNRGFLYEDLGKFSSICRFASEGYLWTRTLAFLWPQFRRVNWAYSIGDRYCMRSNGIGLQLAGTVRTIFKSRDLHEVWLDLFMRLQQFYHEWGVAFLVELAWYSRSRYVTLDSGAPGLWRAMVFLLPFRKMKRRRYFFDERTTGNQQRASTRVIWPYYLLVEAIVRPWKEKY